MPGLNAVGILSYDDVVFDGASSVEVSSDLVKDDARRTVVYHKYVFTVRGVVAPGGDQQSDAAMEVIRHKLGSPSKVFRCVNRGFGTDIIVGPDLEDQGVEDIKCGPMPELLSWKPIGSNRAAEIEWRVVVCIPVCTGARKSGISALNYDMSFAVNKHGDTTRTISGYMEVVVNRRKRNISDSADAHFTKFVSAPLVGFDRDIRRTVSKDRSRVDFTITDTQIPSRNPYPQGVTAISGSHRVRWSRGRGGMRFYNTISLDISPASNVSPALAYRIFIDLVNQRTAFAKTATPPRGVLLDEIEIEEDIWGRACSFSVNYRITTCIPDFLAHTGLWQPVGTNWAQWRTSLSTISGYRGSAGLFADSDVIVDLCGEEKLPSEVAGPVLKNFSPENANALANASPAEPNSYLNFVNVIVPERNLPVVRQQVIQAPTEESPQSASTTDFGFPPQADGKNPDILQEGGEPSYLVRMVGYAEKAGHPVQRPELIVFGETNKSDKTIREVSGTFSMQTIANLLGVPIYRGTWDLVYMLAKSPGETIKVKQNPKECVNNEGSAHQP